VVQIGVLLDEIIVRACPSASFCPTPYALSWTCDLSLTIYDGSYGNHALLIITMETNFLDSLFCMPPLAEVQQVDNGLVGLKGEGGGYLRQQKKGLLLRVVE